MNKWSFSKNIAIAGILCLSIGFLSFAGPGEDYKKKLDAENPVKETAQNISVSSEVKSDLPSDSSVSFLLRFPHHKSERRKNRFFSFWTIS